MVEPQATPRAAILGICLGLALLVLLVYGRALGNEFVLFDDNVYIYENPHVSRGLSWEGLKWAFTSAHASNWHPLTWISHMLDCELFGLAPGPHHAVNVLLHALNTVLLFFALRGMTGALWSAALVALLFAVHPLRVESVAWAAERKDVLSGSFWMMALLAHAWYAKRPGAGRYLVTLGLIALGLMAKPMLVTLPLVLLLLDYWPLGRLARPERPVPTKGKRGEVPRGVGRTAGQLVAEKAPMLALAAASSVITALAQRSGGSIGSVESLPLGARVANACIAYAAYLWQTVWPANLSFFYPHPALFPGGSSSMYGMGAGAALLLCAITHAALRQARARPHLAVGWLWYLVTLVPVIGLVQVGMQARADRYTYLPLIGITIAVAFSLREIVLLRPGARRAVAAACAIVVAALATSAWAETGRWRSSRTLAEHALASTKDNYVAQTTLGLVLEEEGRLEEAQGRYEQALRAKPGYSVAHFNLGLLLDRAGRPAEAVAQFQGALESRPGYAEAHYNLGVVLQKQGDRERAAEHLQRALALSPDHAEAHAALGTLLEGRGDLAGAAEHLRRAIAAKPDYALAYGNLGAVLEKQGDLAGAAEQLERALRIAPATPQAEYNLGVVAAKRGDTAAAVEHFERALAIRPDYAQAHNYLGSLLERSGDLAAAQQRFERAIEIDPRYVEARYNLGVVFARREEYSRAAEQFEQALAVDPGYALARTGLVRIAALTRGAGRP